VKYEKAQTVLKVAFSLSLAQSTTCGTLKSERERGWNNLGARLMQCHPNAKNETPESGEKHTFCVCCVRIWLCRRAAVVIFGPLV